MGIFSMRDIGMEPYEEGELVCTDMGRKVTDLADDLPRPLYEATCILGHSLWSQKQVEELVGRIALLEQTVLRLKTEIHRGNYVTEVSERGAVDATRASSS